MTQEQEGAARDRDGEWRLLEVALASRRNVGEMTVSPDDSRRQTMGIFQPYIYTVFEPAV